MLNVEYSHDKKHAQNNGWLGRMKTNTTEAEHGKQLTIFLLESIRLRFVRNAEIVLEYGENTGQ